MAYRRYEKVDTRIARIFNTYGPRMRLDDGRVVPTFVAQALEGRPITVFGDGKQTRSFCYVDDNVECIWRLLASDYAEPVNVGTPFEMTMLEFAEAVQREVGSSCPIVHEPLPQDDPRIRRPDITRAKQVLSWEPQVPFADGLRRTVAWFRGELGRGAAAVASP
jgi:dTDP-glucose 4,6-dehydratase